MHQLKIYRHFFTNADCYKRAIKQVPKGVQVHSTGANNPYLKRYVQPNDGRLGVSSNHHNKPGLDVCANAYIGKLQNGQVAVYQTLPWDYRCWLSGRASKGNANQLGYIGFEICEDNLQHEDYFQQAVMGASVLLVGYLCQTYNISVDNVRDHHELHAMGLASNHADISHWLKRYGLTMNDYRAAVRKAMAEGIEVKYIDGEEAESVMYEAEVYAANGYPVKMRTAPSSGSSIITNLPVGTKVKVLEETNEQWDKISHDETIGYMMSVFLKEIKEDDTSNLITVDRATLEQIKTNLSAILKIIDTLLNT